MQDHSLPTETEALNPKVPLSGKGKCPLQRLSAHSESVMATTWQREEKQSTLPVATQHDLSRIIIIIFYALPTFVPILYSRDRKVRTVPLMTRQL